MEWGAGKADSFDGDVSFSNRNILEQKGTWLNPSSSEEEKTGLNKGLCLTQIFMWLGLSGVLNELGWGRMWGAGLPVREHREIRLPQGSQVPA